MWREPVVAREDMPVEEATGLMIKENVACLPVVSADNRVRGIVTWRDVLPQCFQCGCRDALGRGEAA